MATVRNTTKYPLPLSTGGVIAPGDAPVNVDPAQALEAALILSGKLQVVDPSIVPPAPQDPLATRARPVYVSNVQPTGMPIGALWLDTSGATVQIWEKTA